MSTTNNVIIVGAGISGLYAGSLLRKANIPFTIVEASHKAGGRVRPFTEFIDWPIDMGAECVHGANNLLGKLIEEEGWPCYRLDHPYAEEYYYIPEGTVKADKGEMDLKSRRLVSQTTTNRHVLHLWEILDNLSKYASIAVEDNITMLQHFKNQKASDITIQLAEAGFANTSGSRLEKLGLLEVAKESVKWSHSGEENYHIGASYQMLFDLLLERVGEENIIYNWPVSTIHYEQPQEVTLISTDGRKVTGRKALVTVSLNILKDGDIHFSPPFPKEKQLSLKACLMGRSGLKLFMKFSRKFWEGNLGTILVTGSIFQEITFNGDKPIGCRLDNLAEAKDLPKSGEPLNGLAKKKIAESYERFCRSKEFLVVGFWMDDFAFAASKLGKDGITREMLKLLDEMFGKKKVTNSSKDNSSLLNGEISSSSSSSFSSSSSSSSEDEDFVSEKVATDCFVDSLMMDWSTEKYVKGSYSYANFGSAGHREVLAKPIANSLFFAGEAYNLEASGFVHGAMETAVRAVDEIVQSLSSTD